MEVAKFFKKDKGKWKYHPYGTVIEEVFVTVKEGQQQAFQEGLSREMPAAMAISVLLVVLGALDIRLLLLGLPAILCLVFYRKHLIKKYCIGTYKANFLKYYFKSVYFFLDEKNEKNYRFLGISTVLWGLAAYYSNSQGEPLKIVATASAFFFLGGCVFVLMAIKRHNNKNTN